MSKKSSNFVPSKNETEMKQIRKNIILCLCWLTFSAVIPTVQAETIDSYGTEFVAISNYKAGEHCVITALFEPTHVTLSNGHELVLMRGERFRINADQWCTPDGTRTRSLYIKADEPIHVEHTTSFGEAYVTTVLPSLSCEAQTEQHYTFSQRMVKPLLFIITPADKLSGFVLDGKVLKMDNSYLVSGSSEWAYAVVDLGNRKAGSVLTLSAPTDRFHAAIVGQEYTYLSPCELEASVSIDTIHSVPQYVMQNGELTQSHTAAMDSLTNELDSIDDELEAMAEDSINHHRAAIYLQGAYAGMPLKMSDYSTSMGLGYGAAAGVMYEFQHRSFLMQTGAGFYWLDRRVNIADQPAPDRYDRALSAGIEVPILFGQNFKAVYYLLGVKLGFDILGKQTSACSPNKVSPASSQPVTDAPIMAPVIREGQYNVIFDLDPRASAEFGFNLGQERSDIVQSRLAFFADWGFYPMNFARVPLPSDPVPVSTMVGNPADYSTYELTHFYSLPASHGILLQHFQVGLKFTLVLGK